MSASNVLKLVPIENVDVSKIQTAQDCIEAAGNVETLAELERLAHIWCKQIEQVCSNCYTLAVIKIEFSGVFIHFYRYQSILDQRSGVFI